MSPAIECKDCGKRFKTPVTNKATPEEMARMINEACCHAAVECLGGLFMKGPSGKPHAETIAATGYWFEPVTGQTQYGFEFHQKKPITKEK
ncbi:MAG: hypothetical protein M1575_02935 [Patescibacteria group bacterium]|nr:hypothetical protein [Patescibacteria group bacterium]MCL5095660.1 hypothetical protein [Patescibacteria group bacterium]